MSEHRVPNDGNKRPSTQNSELCRLTRRRRQTVCAPNNNNSNDDSFIVWVCPLVHFHSIAERN